MQFLPELGDGGVLGVAPLQGAVELLGATADRVDEAAAGEGLAGCGDGRVRLAERRVRLRQVKLGDRQSCRGPEGAGEGAVVRVAWWA